MPRARIYATPAIALLAALLLSGCGNKDDEKQALPSGERSEKPTPETPKDAPKGPFAGFDFAATEARWQGAWVLGGSVAGQQVAWMIDGTKLVEFDGKTEKTYEFELYSPCQVTFTDADAGVTTYKTFTFAGDTLHTGLGSAGTVVGDAMIVCTGGKTYVLRGDECLEWSELFNDWKSEPADCKVVGQGAESKFKVGRSELSLIGDVALVNQQMRGNVAVKHADFAAAKKALTNVGAP